MRNPFTSRGPSLRARLEAAQIGIVDGPDDPDDDTPIMHRSARDPEIVLRDGTPIPPSVQRYIDELRELITSKDTLIEVLGQRLADALVAAAVPLVETMPMPETGLAHELAAVRADRDRLETVNDALRKRLQVKREQIADLREQLRGQDQSAAQRTGIPDELLVPWEERPGPDGLAP